jgi:short subunit dehydrogenase-like uncharacterized protein
VEDAKIVVFGATGYTGELTARSLVDAGEYPLLVGRSPEKLARLAEDLGGLDYVLADAERPDGRIEALLDPGDVLLTTVGPFLKYGRPALEAAIAAGATYLDSTGEPPFVREVFERHGPRAEGRCALLPAFGYDYVLGNLAGALAVREAGEEAVRVERRIAAEGCARNTPSIEPNNALSCSCHLADASTDRSTSSKILAAMPSSNSPLLRKCQYSAMGVTPSSFANLRIVTASSPSESASTSAPSTTVWGVRVPLLGALLRLSSDIS